MEGNCNQSYPPSHIEHDHEGQAQNEEMESTSEHTGSVMSLVEPISIQRYYFKLWESVTSAIYENPNDIENILRSFAENFLVSQPSIIQQEDIEGHYSNIQSELAAILESSNEIETTVETTNSARCEWCIEAVELLLSYLRGHKLELDRLAKFRTGGIKQKLWEEAAAILRYNGFNYSSTQCEVKWKNLKVQIKNGEIEF